jgi:hypothetical protein
MRLGTPGPNLASGTGDKAVDPNRPDNRSQADSDQPAVDPSGRPAPGGAARPPGTEIEELNRRNQPAGPGGQPVDPGQERDPDTAG